MPSLKEDSFLEMGIERQKFPWTEGSVRPLRMVPVNKCFTPGYYIALMYEV
jgi:hypothetical protein